MVRKYLITLILAFAVLAFYAANAGAGKKTQSTLNGTVYSIDSSSRTVTLKSSDGTLTTLNVGSKSKRRRNNRKISLSGLVLGDQATAQYDASNNAKQVSANGVSVGTLQGGVVGVNSGSGAVQLDTGSFGTNVNTRVVRNGQVSSLRSLTSQDQVVAHVTQGSGLATHSSTETGEGSDDTAVDVQVEGPEECEVEGAISAIDLTANTVTITSEYDGGDVTVNVTADTLIEIEGIEAPTIADLAVGQSVDIVYASDTSNALRIEVENEDEEGYAEGPITAIDAAAGSITIDCYGSPVTVFVDASTKIEKDDAPAVFADLQVGDDVMAVYNTTTMIAREVEVYSDEGSD
jgi:Cu/Ag efflux protein CusF